MDWIRNIDFEMIQEIKRMKKPSFFGTMKEIVLWDCEYHSLEYIVVKYAEEFIQKDDITRQKNCRDTLLGADGGIFE